jgi:hypothetical protein
VDSTLPGPGAALVALLLLEVALSAARLLDVPVAA